MEIPRSFTNHLKSQYPLQPLWDIDLSSHIRNSRSTLTKIQAREKELPDGRAGHLPANSTLIEIRNKQIGQSNVVHWQILDPTMSDKLISGAQVAEHNTRESCWIIVHGTFVVLMSEPVSNKNMQAMFTTWPNFWTVRDITIGYM